jgi:hypothetical protein
MQSRILLSLMCLVWIIRGADQQNPWPQAEISNGLIHVSLYLPDPRNGFYRGTRFDWSGVMHRLDHEGHNYYGPWFTKTDPNVIDFIFKGKEVVAGPCSAITGPVEEFSWHEKALGFDKAPPGGTFLKIGVGVLRRPDKEAYNPYRLYEIVNGGKWTTRKSSEVIEFVQDLSDPTSGYAYRYTKTIRLTSGKPEMTLEHTLENTGRRTIETSVYDHNFLVLDRQPIGSDFVVTLPFAMQASQVKNAQLARIDGHQFTYRKELEGEETVSAQFAGFEKTADDYRITIENHKVGAGMQIAGNRPLSKENLWSIRSVLAVEPFIEMSIEPGKTFTWEYRYSYYSLNRTR